MCAANEIDLKGKKINSLYSPTNIYWFGWCFDTDIDLLTMFANI